MQNGRKSHWEKAYEKAAENELSWFQMRSEPSLELIQRHAASKEARIVDVGAGASRLVDGLLEGGFSNITLVDISGSSLDLVARRLGNRGREVRFVCSDITEWKPNIASDIWHDRAVFHFLTDASDQDAYLEVMEAATTAGSKVIIATFALDGPEKCSGLPVRRYSETQLDSRLGASFQLLESMRHVHVTPAGREQPFTFAVFQRS